MRWPRSTRHPSPPCRRAAHELVVAGIAIRRLRPGRRAPRSSGPEIAARQAGDPALAGGSRGARACRSTRRRRASISRGQERLLLLEDVEALLASRRSSSTPAAMSCAIEAWWSRWPRGRHCSRWPARSRRSGRGMSRGRRCWHGRSAARQADKSHRARLRVEIGRLRVALRGVGRRRRDEGRLRADAAQVRDASCSWLRSSRSEHAAVLAFLADGESWSSSALALALGRARAPCSARSRSWRGRQGSVLRTRTGASLDGSAVPGFPPSFVTPSPITTGIRLEA